MQKINLKNKTVFITGSAGFIGSNLVLELLRTQSPINIVGLDNMNDYYDVSIKEWRLAEIENVLPNTQTPLIAFIKEISLTKRSLTGFLQITNRLLW